MTEHIPILKTEIVEALSAGLLATQRGQYFVDCTLGGGGHLAALLEKVGPLAPELVFVAFDRDGDAVERGRRRFAKEIEAGKVRLVQSDFATGLSELGEGSVRGLLADLGFSSDQINSAERGLSFLKEGPLDMRLDTRRGQPVLDWLNRAREEEIADVIFQYGEERHSRRIARAITNQRAREGLRDSTTALADLIRLAYPPKERHGGRIHPATRSFQALRIHVNQELEQLDELLNHLETRLCPGGVVAFLTFHSLEDRRVKQCFRSSPAFERVTKKPIVPSDDEVLANPRARSAKLRIARRVLV